MQVKALRKIASFPRLLLIFLLSSLCSFSALADTSVSGIISTDTTWQASNSPYIVAGELLIQNGATLTIEAGIAVYMSAGASITISSGALHAQGTSQNPIIVTSQKIQNGQTPQPGDWNKIVFLDGTVDNNTKLEHVNIQYGKGLVITSASPMLNYVSIKNHAGPAISMDLHSSPSGLGNQASGNTINGVTIPAGDITGSVKWGLRGIPYVVSSGMVSVGQSPHLQSITPNQISQGETIDAVINGVRLDTPETITFTNPGLTGTILSSGTPNNIFVRLIASQSASLGALSIDLQLASGKVRLENVLNIIPPRPPEAITVFLSPNPIAIPPDSLQKRFFANLSSADSVDRTFSISVMDATLATISPALIAFTAGQTEIPVNITGIRTGQTVIKVESPSLPETLEFPLYVSNNSASINVARSTTVGILKGDPTTGLASFTRNPITSGAVGIVKGDGTFPVPAATSTVLSPLVGITKGDPNLPIIPTQTQPLTSGVVGVEKP